MSSPQGVSEVVAVKCKDSETAEGSHEHSIKEEPEDNFVDIKEERCDVEDEEPLDLKTEEIDLGYDCVELSRSGCDKTYTCTFCEKQFTQRSTLNRHALIHNGDKPYRCNACPKQFTQRGNLKRHMLTHTGEKSLTCKVCGKRFNQKHNLKIHLFTHDEEKPHKCDVCDKTFAQKCYLRNHALSHGCDKLYKCDVCREEFSQRGYLKRGTFTQAGGKPSLCQVCERDISGKYDFDEKSLPRTERKVVKTYKAKRVT